MNATEIDEMIGALGGQLELMIQNKELSQLLQTVTSERDTYKKLLENLLEQKQNERSQ
jgi:N12 class adenine-specific DNA methylase